jgi:hypothetical protein
MPISGMMSSDLAGIDEINFRSYWLNLEMTTHGDGVFRMIFQFTAVGSVENWWILIPAHGSTTSSAAQDTVSSCCYLQREEQSVSVREFDNSFILLTFSFFFVSRRESRSHRTAGLSKNKFRAVDETAKISGFPK